jgi:PAS domain S-box-containing protein
MAREIIIRKSLDGRIIYWSAEAEHAFGYTAGEVLGRHVSMIIPFDWQDEEYQMLDELRTGAAVEERQTVRRSKDGQYWEAGLRIYPLRDDAGKIIGAEKRYHSLRPYEASK